MEKYIIKRWLVYFLFFVGNDIMEFKRLVSVLCSATCGIGGVGAKQNGGMKEKIAQMKKQSEEKGGKSLMTFGNFVRFFFSPGFNEEDREIIEARGAFELLSGKLFGKEKTADIMALIEKLDKNSEAREKIVELAESRKFWISFIEPMRKALTFWACVVNVSSPLLLFTLPIAINGIKQMLSGKFRANDGKLYLPFVSDGSVISEWHQTQVVAASTVHCVLSVLGVLLAATSVGLEYKHFRLEGNKKALEELVKEAEGIQNQAVVSGNKLKEKKSGSSASNGGSQKSDKKGSRKSKVNKRSKVKDKEVDNSAKNEVLN